MDTSTGRASGNHEAIEHLTKYLLDEGFYAALPQERRYRRLDLSESPASLYIGLLGIGYPLLTAFFADQTNFLVVVPLVTIASALLFVWMGAGSKDSKTLLLLMYTYPFILPVAVGFYLGSGPYIYVQLLLASMMFVLISRTPGKKVRLPLIGPSIASMIYVSGRSASSAFSLFPLLLVAILLSVFSQELWQVGSRLEAQTLAGIGLAIWLVALIFVLFSCAKQAQEIVNKSKEETVLSRTLRMLPCLQQKQIQPRSLRLHVTRKVEQAARNRVTFWLTITYTVSSLLLTLVFYLCFFLIFNLLLSQEVLEMWINGSPDISTKNIIPIVRTRILGLDAYSPWSLVGDVSLFLSFILGAQALADDKIKPRASEWIQKKSDQWLAASSALKVYQAEAVNTPLNVATGN